MDIIITTLTQILNQHNVCDSHGIDHACKVMEHAKKALYFADYLLTTDEYECVLLAALLHDVDDIKFFPENTNYQNVRLILKNYSNDSINLIITMISLVSSSKNADDIPSYVIGKEWLLIPRYADRLEALGIIGIERCLKYNKTINQPLYLSTTIRIKNNEQLWNVATEERYNSYNGNSISMLDHYYDKLIRLSLFPINNEYLNIEAKNRNKIIIDFVLYFGEKESITYDDVTNYINLYKCNK